MVNKKTTSTLILLLLILSFTLGFVVVKIPIVKAAPDPDAFYWMNGNYDSDYGTAISGKVMGDYLYISCHVVKKFAIFDISTKSNPILVGTAQLTQRPREGSISSDGNYAFISSDGRDAGNGTVMIINCTDKANPAEMSSISPLSSTNIEGAYYVESIEVVFCTDYDNDQLHSINVSDKLNPTLLDSVVGTGNQAHAVWANETVACTVNWDGYGIFATFDVSNASNMSFLDSESMGGLSAQLNGIDNPIIYASCAGGSSFSIFDISNPSVIDKKSTTIVQSSRLTMTTIPDSSNSSVLYVAAQNSGDVYADVSAWNIDNLTSPSFITSIGVSNDSYYQATSASMCASDNYLYLIVQGGSAGGLPDGGVTVIRYGDEITPYQPEEPIETPWMYIAIAVIIIIFIIIAVIWYKRKK